MVSHLLSKKIDAAQYRAKLSDPTLDALDAFKSKYQKELDPYIYKQLEFVLYCSRYAQQLLIKYPDLFLQFSADGDYRKPIKVEHLEQELFDILQFSLTKEDAFFKLRYFRHYHHLRILVNDLFEFFSPQQTMQELSTVSDVIVRQTAQYVHTKISEQYALDFHKISPLTIIAVGKLGGKELNFSSDIDLILGYPEQWECEKIQADSFYHQQAKLFMQLLSAQNEHGFVYRVDLRLRPFGAEGAVVLPYSGFDDYYQNHGRPWERYALVKARVIYGDNIDEIEKVIHQFVYHNPEDNRALETLRVLRSLIEKEVLSKQLQHDIKRGLGGIRQIEFIVQLFQLVYGFEEEKLQTQEWFPALKILKKKRLLSLKQYKMLKKNYYFLREIEHYLQIDQDKQTHLLPRVEDAQERLSTCMQAKSWELLEREISKVRKEVNELFENILMDAHHHEDHYASTKNINIYSDWQQPEILAFFESDLFKSLDNIAKNFCIDMIKAAYDGDYKHDDALIEKFISFLESIVQREGYILLFRLNPDLVYHVINLFNQSPWCARNLNQFPSLLHELASMEPLQEADTLTALMDELRQIIISIPEDDTEQLSEGFRKFKLRQFMKVAYSDVNDTLPLMKVSDQLTFSAEAIIKNIFLHVVQCMQKENPEIDESAFKELSIIAYGKLGGIELSYQSDLDLVFLHNGSMEYEKLYIRMAQRIIALMEKPLRTGKLYDVDTRLRPSGHAGLLVNHYSAFEDYLQYSAWTWEYQALTRARHIAGSEASKKRFDNIRYKILTKPRDVDVLRIEVFEMRERLRRQKIGSYSSENYAQVAEAIKDIEFIVQFLSLSSAPKYPEVIKWSDNIRILEQMAKRSVLPEQEALKMIEAYQVLRAKLHEHALKEHFQLERSVLDDIQFVCDYEQRILG